MPFTYLAHQAPVLAIKRRWPAFDGTALALGSMAPDWAYALSGSRLAFDAHTIWGVGGFCIPATVVAALVVRAVAPVLFAYLPNPSAMPLRRLRFLGAGRPAIGATLFGAFLGALTHVAWDLFTHDNRWGPRHIGWLRATALTVAAHDVTVAKVLQYGSHILGSVAALFLLRGLLRSQSDRCERRPRGGTWRFASVSAVGVVVGGYWASGDPGVPAQVIRLSAGLGAGLAVASVACRRFVDCTHDDQKGLTRLRGQAR